MLYFWVTIKETFSHPWEIPKLKSPASKTRDVAVKKFKTLMLKIRCSEKNDQFFLNNEFLAYFPLVTKRLRNPFQK